MHSAAAVAAVVLCSYVPNGLPALLLSTCAFLAAAGLDAGGRAVAVLVAAVGSCLYVGGLPAVALMVCAAVLAQPRRRPEPPASELAPVPLTPAWDRPATLARRAFAPRQPLAPPPDFWMQWTLGASRAAVAGAALVASSSLWSVPSVRKEWVKRTAQRLLLPTLQSLSGFDDSGPASPLSGGLWSPPGRRDAAWERRLPLADQMSDLFGTFLGMSVRHRYFRRWCVFATARVALRLLRISPQVAQMAAAPAWVLVPAPAAAPGHASPQAGSPAGSPVHSSQPLQAVPLPAAAPVHASPLLQVAPAAVPLPAAAGSPVHASPPLAAPAAGPPSPVLVVRPEQPAAVEWDAGLWERDRCETREEKGRRRVAAEEEDARAAAAGLRPLPPSAAVGQLCAEERAGRLGVSNERAAAVADALSALARALSASTAPPATATSPRAPTRRQRVTVGKLLLPLATEGPISPVTSPSHRYPRAAE
eukprot:TRINITY_DN3563_c0_g1_i1.p1 TRINITY_DN3563_c0_g1~~TRINITY_DN3563_c0_g1_i1.p1  ORF type:complete len:477 (+),score=178.83 TRINITY_DN3563_c0_g1_i1:94-1524(+)